MGVLCPYRSHYSPFTGQITFPVAYCGWCSAFCSAPDNGNIIPMYVKTSEWKKSCHLELCMWWKSRFFSHLTCLGFSFCPMYMRITSAVDPGHVAPLPSLGVNPVSSWLYLANSIGHIISLFVLCFLYRKHPGLSGKISTVNPSSPWSEFCRAPWQVQ